MSPAASKGPQGPGPYWWLLAAYPRGYRTEHGREILATLAETTGPGSRIPPLREIAGLVRGGLATRPRYTAQGPVPWWADGIHLGVFLLALLDFVPSATYVLNTTTDVHHRYALYALLPLMVAVALMRGWVWVALPPAAVMVFEASRDLVGVHDLFQAIPDYRFPSTYTGATILQYWLILAGLITLAARHPRNLRHRSWCWWLPMLLGIPVLLGMLRIEVYAQTPNRPTPFPSYWLIEQPAYRVGLLLAVVGLLLVALWATVVSGDFRWTLATTIVMITGELSTLRNLPKTLHDHNASPLVYYGATAILLTATVLRARRVSSDPSP